MERLDDDYYRISRDDLVESDRPRAEVEAEDATDTTEPGASADNEADHSDIERIDADKTASEFGKFWNQHKDNPFWSGLVFRAENCARINRVKKSDPWYEDALMEFITHAVAVVSPNDESDGAWGQRYRSGDSAMIDFLRKQSRPLDARGFGVVSAQALAEASTEAAEDGGIAYAYDFVADTKTMPPDVAAMYSEMSEALHAAIADLPTKMREILDMFWRQKMLGREIADALGYKSESSVTELKKKAMAEITFRMSKWRDTLEEVLPYIGPTDISGRGGFGEGIFREMMRSRREATASKKEKKQSKKKKKQPIEGHTILKGDTVIAYHTPEDEDNESYED